MEIGFCFPRTSHRHAYEVSKCGDRFIKIFYKQQTSSLSGKEFCLHYNLNNGSLQDEFM